MMEKSELRDIFENKYIPKNWKTVLKNVFNAKVIHQQPLEILLPLKDLANTAYELGNSVTTDGRLIGFYQVNLKPKPWIEINRVGLRNLLRNVYKNDVDGALIVFVQDNKWRFTYVSEIRELNEEGVIVRTETEPKRYTYLMGEGEVCRTASDRFFQLQQNPASLNDIKEAFSVEKLNKEFFKDYKEFYELFYKYLINQNNGYRQLFVDNNETDIVKQEKPIRDFVKILLGRFVFLHFIQKKGWMGVSIDSPNWIGGDKHFIQKLYKNFPDQNKFHSKALRSLFFETLNTKRDNNLAPEILGSKIKIPYLNGGLFEPDISYRHSIDFPKNYFADLLYFFTKYNFTIDENSPDDQEVGIDPEMLGHIFENLLEENREKGAFYTPKEIVKYMCQESLIEYLYTHLCQSNISDEEKNEIRADIELLIRKEEVGITFLNSKKAQELNKLLKNVKICDPAIGSGAFPMGLLKEIFETRRLLHSYITPSQKFNRSAVKKEIIQNSIYGVDLDIGAVEISRLRFWLSLVVDENEPEPLPSLDYKIIQGNSLLQRFEDIDLKFEKVKFKIEIIKEVDLFGNIIDPQITITEYLQAKEVLKEFNISELEDKFFKSEDVKEKQIIKQKIEIFEKNFIDERLLKLIDDSQSDLFQQKEELNEIEEAILNSKAGNTPAKQNKFEKALASIERKKKAIYKLEKEIERLEDRRKFVKDLPSYKKPWFLWNLYFMNVIDEGGFDIVIGNPPYIKEYTDRSAFDGLRNTKYFQGKMDIWYYFACHCLDLLKHNGIECFIAQNNWITSAGASILREKVLKEAEIKIFTDFGDYKVFQSAGIQTMIYLLHKIQPRESYITRYRRLNVSNISSEKLGLFLNNINQDLQNEYIKFLHQTNPSDYFDDSISFNEPWVINILNDIVNNDNIIFLSEKEITQGIVEPQDKLNESNQKILGTQFKVGQGIFQISTSERKSMNLSAEELGLLRPFYSTSQLKRYNSNLETDEWLIYTKSNINRTISNYPQIKNHLDNFKKIITSDFGPYGLHRARDEKFFLGEKIMSLRKCEKPTFTYTNFDCFVSQTYFIIKTNRINLKYLTTILNSKLIEFWLKYKGKRQGNLFQIDKGPLLNIPIKITESILKFEIIFDYLTFLNDNKNPSVNQYSNNEDIAKSFEDLLNSMIYEIYFEQHMKDLEIDILKFIEPDNNFCKITELQEIELKSKIINNVYYWLQEQDNPIRNRIILSNIKSKDIIRKINSVIN